MIGLVFADESEAKIFFKKVTKRKDTKCTSLLIAPISAIHLNPSSQTCQSAVHQEDLIQQIWED